MPHFLTTLGVGLLTLYASIAQSAEPEYAPIAPMAVRSTLIDIERTASRLIAVGERGHVLYSDDKGDTWQQGKMPFRRMLTGVHFVDAQRGWAVGHQNMIFHTSDGGETWERQVDGFAFQGQYNRNNVEHTRARYEALKAELEVNPDPDRELELEDALFAFEDAEFAVEEPTIPTNFHDVWFMDRSNGWAVGAFGRLAETRDGGKTWADKSHLVYTLDGFHLNSITGNSDGEIYIAGESGLMFRSLDAGKSWEQMDVGYYGSFFGVTYDPVNDLLHIFGLGNALYRSSDKGVTWEAMAPSSAGTFAGGTVTANGETLLVGPGGMVLLIDGETGFTQAHMQADRRNYSAAVVVGSGELVVVGQGGPHKVSIQ